MAKLKGKPESNLPYVRRAETPLYGASPSSVWLTFAFVSTLFLSALLLFLVQPIAGKLLLPLLGGAPAVWTTCMLFFQAALLGGYLYAHLLSRHLSLKKQFIIHGLLLVSSFLVLPLGITNLGDMATRVHPVLAVFAILSLCVGLPFFSLSANAPLLQRWFSHSNHELADDPYFLYVASNVGSLLALVAYPVILEPTVGIGYQGKLWSIAFVALIVLIMACAKLVSLNRRDGVDEEVVESQDSAPPSWRDRLRWVFIAAIPSSLMLGVTTHFATDIASIPLLWVVPLTCYLLSYILVFAKWPYRVHQMIVACAPVAVLVLLYVMFTRVYLGIGALLLIHLGTFFLLALVFHGQLAFTRPAAQYLTQFYLCTSLGGVVGGLFNGIIAPIIFVTALEYPIALVAAAFFIPLTILLNRIEPESLGRFLSDALIALILLGVSAFLLIKWPFSASSVEWIANLVGTKASNFSFYLHYFLPIFACGVIATAKRPVRFGLSVAAFVIAATVASGWQEDIVHRERSFFGILKVYNDPVLQARRLLNGTTLHGMQFLRPSQEREPLTYYHQNGPVGDVFREFRASTRNQSVAAIGLGTGTLSSYAKPGENFTFYEIDKAVQGIASTYFNYLKNAPGKVDIVLGDARLKLAEASDHSYGLILVDAFSSDSIPVHLLTREAVELYFSKLADRGLVAIHISNRYLRLEPIVAMLAKDKGLVALVNTDKSDNESGKFASTWTLLARSRDDFGTLTSDSKWQNLEAYSWMPVWTDDFSSILSVLVH